MVWLPLGDEPHPPPRTNVGTSGRPIKLRANYFTVAVKREDIKLAHYDVVIKDFQKRSVQLPKKKRLIIFERMKETHGKIFGKHHLAYDSEKNAYGVNVIPRLKKSSLELEVYLEEKHENRSKFFVTLTKVNEGFLGDLFKAVRSPTKKKEDMPQFIFQMIEVMFQHSPSLRYERVGRNSFYPTGGEFGPSHDIGGGKEAMMGFFGSLRPAAWKDGSLLLNIDLTNTAFYKEQSVLDFMMEALNYREGDFKQSLNPVKKKGLLKALKNLKVQVTHTAIPRKYRVIDVGPLGADRQTFPLDTGSGKVTQCTVEAYFLNTYKRRLKYARLNCLKVAPENKNIYLPLEVCKIAKGQRVAKKLIDTETAQFIRKTAKLPSERLQKIQEISRAQNFSMDPMMQALEFSVSDKPVDLNGRVLPAPKLQMNEEVLPNKGVWDTRNRTFFVCGTLNHWAVLNYDAGFTDRGSLNRFLGNLRRIGQERGMTIQEPLDIQEYRDPRTINPEVNFRNLKTKFPGIEMILVVLPNFKEVYGQVKNAGDRIVHVISQCVRGQNVRKNEPATVSNILLKINAKIGGTNNVLGTASRPVVFNSPVMIMGADVNHPSALDKVTPSLAAVVASIDRFASKYAVEVRHQKHRCEMIQELKDMTRNLLITFYRATKRKPERIIMFRDGVSESQFLSVLSFELTAMRDACTSLEKGYEPAITFLVVQKRHHTRLFCQDRDAVGRSKNIPPGTTVDTFITHPTERDFYLCSHQGILGTSKPTHYHILWDDSDLSMDVMQKLTYALCHLYSRCTRSVSIPTPAYYAHLVAFRAKVHLQDICGSETSSLASGEEEGPSDAVMIRATRMDNKNEIASKLYFV